MRIYPKTSIYNNQWKSWWMLPLFFLFIIACKKEVDQPPYQEGDPNIKVNATIRDVQNLYAGKNKLISDSLVFSGIVISNDSTNNLNKQIFVEDSTGGISIQLDGDNLFENYPIGARVFVKAGGLMVGAYGGVIELGVGANTITGQMQGISSTVMQKYVIAGSIGHYVEPLHLTIAQLNPRYQGMLVQIDSVEFADINATYADSTKGVANVNLNLENCSGDTIVLRSNSYANFAGKKVMGGKGNVTAIYTNFNNTNYLLIRSLSDVAGMTASRCGAMGGIVASIADLRSQYTGKDIVLSMGSFDGVVVSSATNEAANNYKITSPDNSAGIVLYQSGLSLNLGDKVTVDLAGAKLTTYRGDLELINVKSVKTNETGVNITPAQMTITDLTKSKLANSTRLVTLSNLTLKAPSTTSGNATYTLSDGSNTISSFVRSTSSIVLQDGTVNITGYVSLYNDGSSADTTIQVNIRSLDDVVYTSGGNPGGTTPGNAATALSEDFSSVTAGNNSSTSGSGTAWTGNDNFPIVERAYSAGGMVKLGTASVVGSITSKNLDLSGNGGKFTVSFDVKGWSAAGEVVVSTSNGESQTVTYTNTMTGSVETKSLQFTKGVNGMTVTISTDKNAYRAFVGNVKITN